MPKYIYTAKSQPQTTVQGKLEAETEQEAINKLTKMGYFPISVKNEKDVLDAGASRRFWKVPKKEIVLFTRQLSSLIESGVNILNSLNIIAEQAPNKYLRVVLGDILAQIKDGKPLSDSLAAYPNLFPALYVAMIRTGESSGNLNETARRLADLLEKQDEFKSSVRAALVYPFFLIGVGIITVTVLLTFVIPRLVVMFEDMGQALPLPTQILINLSSFLEHYWWLILAVIFILVFLFKRAYSKPQGKASIDRFRLRIPLLGEIILKTEISNMMRTLSLLLSSGLPIISSLEIAISILDSEVLKKELEQFKGEISQGASFSSCLKTSNYFPVFVTNIVTVGEETGALDRSLLRIAEDYEKDTDRYLKTLTRLLEPSIILIMGLIVGFIVLSMLLPIFQINIGR